jgi:hypothetical protein
LSFSVSFSKFEDSSKESFSSSHGEKWRAPTGGRGELKKKFFGIREIIQEFATQVQT